MKQLPKQLITLLLSMLAAGAASADKPIGALPLPRSAEAEVSIDIDKRTARIGETVTFSFSATRYGYMSLWSNGTSGAFIQLFPNSYTGDGAVVAGTPYGAGGQNDDYIVQVAGPPGIEEIYAIWTERLEDQPKPEDAPSARALAGKVARTAGAQAASMVRLEILEDEGEGTRARGLRVHPPKFAGAAPVWALVAGANTNGLLHADEDAQTYAGMLREAYGDRLNLRLLTGVTSVQLLAGLDWLLASAHMGDTVHFYFSGNGAVVTDNCSDEHDGYDEVLVTRVDVEHDTDGRWFVSDDVIRGALEAMPDGELFVVLDTSFAAAIRDGLEYAPTGARPKTLVKGRHARVSVPEENDGFDLPHNATALLAAGEGQQALETYRGGLLTLGLIETAGERDFTAWFKAAARHAAEASAGLQIPHFFGGNDE